MKNFILILSIFCSTQLFSQWELIAYDEDEPHFNNYKGLHFFNVDTGFVVGIIDEMTGIIRTHDGGETWDTTYTTDIGIPPTTAPYSLSFPNDSVGYIGCSGDVLKTVDGGDTWFSLDTADNWASISKWYNILFINQDTGFIASSDGGAELLRTYDGGWTWEPDLVMHGARSFNENEGVITGCAGPWAILDLETLVWIKSNSNLLGGGLGLVYYNCIYNDDKLIAIGNSFSESRAIYAVSEDEGESWNMRYFEIYNLEEIQFVSPLNGFCSGVSIGTYNTYDGGETWWRMELEDYGADILTGFEKFQMLNDTLGYGISSQGIFKTTNGGGTPQYEIESYDFVSVDENTAIDFTIYPNPTQADLTISASDINFKTVKIFTLNGQLVIEEVMNSNSIRTSSLSPGQYILQLFSDDTVYEMQFVKE